MEEWKESNPSKIVVCVAGGGGGGGGSFLPKLVCGWELTIQSLYRGGSLSNPSKISVYVWGRSNSSKIGVYLCMWEGGKPYQTYIPHQQIHKQVLLHVLH